MTSYIKIKQILKLKSKDNTSKTLHAKFYVSRIKNKRIRRGEVKYAPRVWSVFKSPGKIGLSRQVSQGKRIVIAHVGTKSVATCGTFLLEQAIQHVFLMLQRQ